MYLRKSQSSSGLGKRFSARKALRRFTQIIEELNCPTIDEPKSSRTPRKLLLFRSYYFKAITHLQRKEQSKAKDELKNALRLCDEVFGPNADDNEKATAQREFDNLRIKSGILRLLGKFDDAQEYDRKALSSFYKSNATSQPNLDLADLVDDYGNTYALIGRYEKAIEHVEHALRIRELLLPSAHVKIFNSYNKLAYLHGINAMKSGALAHKIIEKLIDERGQDEDREKTPCLIRAPSPSVKGNCQVQESNNGHIPRPNRERRTTGEVRTHPHSHFSGSGETIRAMVCSKSLRHAILPSLLPRKHLSPCLTLTVQPAVSSATGGSHRHRPVRA